MMVEAGSHRILVDCGEGTQRQLLRSGVGFRRLNRILLTHAHFDRPALGPEEARVGPMTIPVSRDAETVAKALLDLETFLGAYLQPGDRDADETLTKIIELLDRRDVVLAASRIVASYGLHVVK
jgi:Metallo-beta-lactamase superfamily